MTDTAQCPHCGATPGPILYRDINGATQVVCNFCGAAGPYGDSCADALALWNRRAVAERLQQMSVPQRHDGPMAQALRREAAEMAAACTCPSGDGSLRWPCPVHKP